MLLAGNLLVAQVNSLNRKEKLEQLKNRDDTKVTEVEPDLIMIEYPDGKTLYKNVGDYKPQTNKHTLIYSPTYDSTIIDLRYIDTTLYHLKYQYWQEVPINNWQFDHLRIGDVNLNGKIELYGVRKFFWEEQKPIAIYELNELENFEFKYQYDSVNIARSIYDVDGDQQNEVILTLPPLYGTGNQQKFFSKPTQRSFATELNFILNFPTAQLDDITMGDLDGDEFTDLLFARNGWTDIHILEYNPVINNFDSVYRFDISEPPPWWISGFSVGDFDIDNKTDLVFGSMRGNVFVIENKGDNQYTNSWQGSVESYHAYIHTPSNDVDKNGKPEFWVLADAYYNGVGTTRLTIFENNGDNNYQAAGRVDLIGIFSFYAGTIQALDIDKDGTQEIVICIDDNFLILKFNGSRNHQTYELYYIKQNDLWTQDEFTTYYGAIMYDLNQNGNYEILISMIHILWQQTGRFLTKIYKPDSTSNVKEDDFIPQTNKLYQNYPNPFNPETKIKYSIPKINFVSLKIYDLLGNEIATLVNEEKPSGVYEVEFNASNLSSGIYFYRLQAGEFILTKKLVLLK